MDGLVGKANQVHFHTTATSVVESMMTKLLYHEVGVQFAVDASEQI